MICTINTRRDLTPYTEDVCSFYFPDGFQKFVNTKPNSVQIFSLLTVVQHFSPFLLQERVGEGWLHHRGHGALTHQLCLFLVWWPPDAAGRFSQMTWWNWKWFHVTHRNSFIPSFLLITYHIRTYIARRLDSARARVRIPGLFLKAVLKWEGMHTLYAFVQAGGAMVYAGAVSEVKPYFVSCGFPFPEEHFLRSLPNASELLSYAPVANLF